MNKQTTESQLQHYQKAHWKFSLIVIALSLLLLFSIVYSITFGSVNISWQMVYQIIYGQVTDNSAILAGVDSGWIDIVWMIRLPRVLLATAVGASLALTGTVMQAILRNPLADPYVLGISSGASLGATLSIMLGVGISFGANYIGVCAFLGALLASLIVLFLGNFRNREGISRLLLVGVALSSLCSALSSFIVFISGRKEGMQTLNFWLLGSLTAANWQLLKVLLPLVLVICLFFCFQSRVLNLMLLGDETARTLGRENFYFRILYILLVSILCGFVVYACGIIGFVGLVVPHITRILVGVNHRRMVPVTILFGAIFLIWTDVLSRMIIKGSEIPIGIIVSAIGAPFFLYLVMQNPQKRGGK
ncbi:iron complex transport system permease protein [Enterococcus sp. PF1-24]|uniref:FecCD family ABC transporter permease n=1 Tax=unclassified Enterococcus TaxID=2608891 RepID=UPI00247620D4|nr:MULTISPECIES: iron ABC transporter permease [unclassified Enterococcus]MDH6364906.1 iron complex transport system permease protein [Enterococcus sp. PFB1-1]MDH6402007.1 iron complex transport system permease protein [Enterococcus sp. PF1-24]